jgi:hypothetical protein
MLIYSATKADFAADVRQNVIEARRQRPCDGHLPPRPFIGAPWRRPCHV